MADALQAFLDKYNGPQALKPLVSYDAQKYLGGGQKLTNMQLGVASNSILNHSPLIKKDNTDHGIWNDLKELPGNFMKDATQTVQGFFSPWKWVPTIFHNIQKGDVNSLLPLIPGYTTAKDLINGDFHDILQHPAGTLLDVSAAVGIGMRRIIGPGLDAVAADAPTTFTRNVESGYDIAKPTLINKADRMTEAVKNGHLGSVIYNTLPDTIIHPQEGWLGTKLESLKNDSRFARASSIANRGFQSLVTKEYADPLLEAFKEYTADERKGFAQWMENRQAGDTHWTDVQGMEHPVPPKFLDTLPHVESIVSKFETLAHDYLHRVHYGAKSYLYDSESPVVKHQALVAEGTKVRMDTTTVVRDETKAWVEEGSKPVAKSTTKAMPPGKYTKSNYELFRIKGSIEGYQKDIDRLEASKGVFKNRTPERRVAINQKIDHANAELKRLQPYHDFLSQRELLMSRLKKNPNYLISAEEYKLLNIGDAGMKAIGKRVIKAYNKYDGAVKNLEEIHKVGKEVLARNAPATFFPRIRDLVLHKVIEDHKAINPDFLEGSGHFDFAATKAALDREFLGKGVVEAGLVTQKEFNTIFKEIESSWQTLADQGLNPIYLSSVPRENFTSIMDPNLFKSGAMKDTPRVVQGRVRDITPSGVADPVIGLTAPALAILRKGQLQHFYNNFVTHFVMDEAKLTEFLDNEIRNSKLTDGASTLMGLRKKFKEARWSPLDPEKLAPEIRDLLPSEGQVYLPKTMNDALQHLFKSPEHALQTLSQTNTRGLRIFRTSIMTASVKHLAHVMFGGMTMLMLRGGVYEISPSRMIEAWGMAKNDLLPHGLSAGADFYSGEEMGRTLLPKADRNSIIQKTYGKIGDAATGIQKFEDRISNFERSLSYLAERDRILGGKLSPDMTGIESADVRAALERGDIEHATKLAHDGALRHANKALIDFDGMLPAEKGIIRNVFPFYAFTRQIFKSAFTFPIDYPLRAAVLYRLGDIMQKEFETTGLPMDWMRYLTFGPNAQGDVTNVDLRFINPFRTMPDLATGGGVVGSLNPFIGYALSWAGVNQFTSSADRFTDIRYNPETGYVETKRKPFSLVDLVKGFIPEVGATDLITKSGDAQYNTIPKDLFLPGFPYRMNQNLQIAKDQLGIFSEAQQAVAQALRSGDTKAVREFNVVPFQGQLVPGVEVAKLIDGLKGTGPPKRQLGISR